jgi:hypothetical protein
MIPSAILPPTMQWHCCDAGACDGQRSVPGQPLAADSPGPQRSRHLHPTTSNRNHHNNSAARGQFQCHSPCCTRPSAADRPRRHACLHAECGACTGAGSSSGAPERRLIVGRSAAAEQQPDTRTDRPAEPRQQAPSSPWLPRSVLVCIPLDHTDQDTCCTCKHLNFTRQGCKDGPGSVFYA